MLSWHRPLGRFSPVALLAVMLAAFGIYTTAVVLIDTWFVLFPALLSGCCFGLAASEATIRQLICARWFAALDAATQQQGQDKLDGHGEQNHRHNGG
jgi:hypothetical protein